MLAREPNEVSRPAGAAPIYVDQCLCLESGSRNLAILLVCCTIEEPMGNSTDSIAPITDERSSLLRRSLEQGEIAGERLSQHEHNLTEIILTKWRACLIIFFFALLIFIQSLRFISRL